MLVCIIVAEAYKEGFRVKHVISYTHVTDHESICFYYILATILLLAWLLLYLTDVFS